MPSWLTGLLGGINEQADANYARRERQRQLDDAAERDVLSKLASDESITPEIRTRAVTAMLESASGGKRPVKGGFLGGLLGTGAIEPHPAVVDLFNFMKSPEMKSIEYRVPAAHPTTVPTPTAQGSVAPPPAQGAAAMPPTPAGEAGGGPPQVSAVGSPSGPVTVTPPPRLSASTAPIDLNKNTEIRHTQAMPVSRQIFRSQEEMATEKYRAQYLGQYSGKAAALRAAGATEEEIKTALLADIMGARGAGAAAQSIAGEVTNPDGTVTPAFAVFDRRMQKYIDPDTGDPMENFRPRTTTGSKSFGADREALSLTPEYGGVSYAQNTPENRTRIDTEIRRRVGEQAYQRGLGTANAAADAPLSHQNVFQNISSLRNDFQRWTDTAQHTLLQEGIIEEAARQAIGFTDAQGTFHPGNMQQGKSMAAQSQALISAFQRMVDDLSAVRNEEYDRLGNNQSIHDQIAGWWTRVTQGGAGVTAAEIQNVVNAARGLAKGRKEYIKNKAVPVLEQARSENFDVNQIFAPDIQQYLGIAPANLPGRGTVGPPQVPTPPPAMPGATPPPQVTPTTPPSATAAPAAAAPPPAVGTTPQKGDYVGNVYTGPIIQSNGKLYGTLDGKTSIELTEHNGQYYY